MRNTSKYNRRTVLRSLRLVSILILKSTCPLLPNSNPPPDLSTNFPPSGVVALIGLVDLFCSKTSLRFQEACPHRRMDPPFFHEFKKLASSFIGEKIKNARLALTDVTPAELLTEEATSANSLAPDAKTMGFLSRAAFEIDDYWRIVQVLHKRFAKFDRRYWREPYNALVLLDHLLTHGPESVADEFLCDKHVIEELGNFQHIDEKGFNWGFAVRKKSERVLKLLKKGPVLKEERDRARKITREIQGFGSFSQRQPHGDMDGVGRSSDYFGRWNSYYEVYGQKDEAVLEKLNYHGFNSDFETCDQKSRVIQAGERSINGEEMGCAGKESKGISSEESMLLLAVKDMDKPKIVFQIEEHPFINHEHQRKESMLLLRQ